MFYDITIGDVLTYDICAMNLLTGYESSGDEDEQSIQPIVPSYGTVKKIECTRVSTSSSSSSNSSALSLVDAAPKKKRAVIFSTLPIEIQNALTRGSTTQDSDSDDDLSSKQTAAPTYKAKFNGGGLMNLLPAPKNASTLLDKAHSIGSKSHLNVVHSKETVVRLPKKFDIDDIVATTSEKCDSDGEDGGIRLPAELSNLRGGSMFSLNSASNPAATLSKLAPSIGQYRSAFIAPNFSTQYEDKERFQTDQSIYSSSNSDNFSVASASTQLAAFNANNYESTSSGPSNQRTAEYELFDGAPDGDLRNSSIARKKRERDIEQQLLSGNIDAAQSMGVGMKEVGARNDWNAHAYTTQKQNEAELHRAFFAAKGGEKAIAPVTKQQGRKHQINSLVMLAAKTELALLNAKGERNLSKQETRGKYGW